MCDTMIFEWDDKKAVANVEKHGLSFDNAIRIFADDKRRSVVDDRFDYGEERLITMGRIDGRLSVVVYTEKEDIIRIISARKANKKEQKKYGNR